MSYPGLTFALMVGVAIGTAIYYYFKNENPNQGYQYHSADNCYDDRTSLPPPSEGYDTLRSTKRRRNSNNPHKCSICLDKLSSNTTRISCGHIFHTNCITMWFRTSQTCPNCRNVELQ